MAGNRFSPNRDVPGRLRSVARFIADCFDHFPSGGDPS
jgi:hypothetical protein